MNFLDGKPTLNAAAYAGVGTSVFGSFFEWVQPGVAVFAGVAGGAWACLQIYDWWRGRRKK